MTREMPHEPPEWRYGESRLTFRGPPVDPDAPHIAVLGSDEVAGRYVPTPMTVHMAEALGVPVANLGVHSGGIDAILGDEGVLDTLARATAAAVQAMPAHMMSNRLYTVHPRRNDRIVAASSRMRALWPEIDFTDYSFVRHMLGALHAQDPVRFAAVAEELATAWTARMAKLVAALPERRVLAVLTDPGSPSFGCEPLFVTDAAVGAVAASFDAVVPVDMTGLRGHPSGLEEMTFDVDEAAAARSALPPEGHERAAAALVAAVAPLLDAADPAAARPAVA